MYLVLISCFLISFVYFTSTFAMGLFTDIRKRLNSTPSTSLEGYGERSAPSSVSRGRTGRTSRSQQRRPQQPDTDSQDSGVVIVRKDSSTTVQKVPKDQCPNCAAAAAAAAPTRNVPASVRPSMDRKRSFSSSRPPPHVGHVQNQQYITDAGHDHSRPGTGYSNQSGVPPMQHHHNHHHHGNGFNSRPISWGRRATTENNVQEGPNGYSRPVTPPYSVTSEQTGWNSGQRYNDMYGHYPGPASHDGDFSGNGRPNSWRRNTSSHLNLHQQDQRQPRSFANSSAGGSRAPSETGSNHPRNASKNMENTAYEAGYRDGMY